MKHLSYILLLYFLLANGNGFSQSARMLPAVTPAGKGKVDTRIDNIGYWKRMVQAGYVLADTTRRPAPSQFTGTAITPWTTPRSSPFISDFPAIIDSPDLPVTEKSDVTQSENSVFIDPNDENTVLNSNNSSTWIQGYALNALGADALWSEDAGESWEGSTQGVNGTNAGDPSVAIGPNGWWYVGRISGSYGQAVSYSKDRGKTWKRVNVGAGPTSGLGMLDKNHLWVDHSPSSPFKGNLYDAWTNFIPGSPDTNAVQVVRSTNQGLTWSAPFNISAAAGAVKLNHGVNLQTGPGGELYAAWSIYDTWPSDETAIGFARSFDGGGTFQPATRIIQNIKGIRASMTRKNMRVNSFPSMAVDISNGPHQGTLYLVWANTGYPGINTGTDIDIYLIKSTDQGNTWSSPVRVNQDPPGLGKQHFFPWIACDRVTGGLAVVYYDDRNADTAQVATYVSVSYDGGNSWTDMQVSDHIFTPEPIPGLAFSYFGDYIGIQTANMKVFPMWTSNHENNRAMTYVSPFDLGPNPGQPWVMYYSDSLATVSGTGGTGLNTGDSLHLTLGLKNAGDQPAIGVNARVTSTSPYITVTDTLATFGTMEAGTVAKAVNGYALKVSDTIPDNLMVRFEVKAWNADSAWYSHFSVESHAPALAIGLPVIYDTIAGNGNGRLDPGETARIVFSVSNTGDFDCTSAFVRFETASPYLSAEADSVYIGLIPARGARSAVFTVMTSPATPIGNGSDVLVTARSGLYHAERTYRIMTGQVVEDWETNTFTRYPWQWAGSNPWTTATYLPREGSYCAGSGVINDYQNSQLFITYTCAVADTLSFWVRTSSEQDYDFLMFSIDNVLQDQWSGETPWTRAAYRVNAGTHTFKWLYLKDLAISNGFDRVWVDFIAFPPPTLPMVDPGTNDTVCAGITAILQGYAEQYDSLRWTTSGDGTFLSDTSAVTSYHPGAGDIGAGQVLLTLTGYSSYGNTALSKTLYILPAPSAAIAVSPNDTLCAGQTVMLQADTAGVSAWQWMPGGFSTPVAAYDTALLNGAGLKTIRLAVTGRNGCQAHDSVALLFRDCTGIDTPDSLTTRIYPNPCNGILTLETGEPAGPVSFSLTDLFGMVRYRTELETRPGPSIHNLDLGSLPAGVYIVSIRSGHGTTLKKLVITSN